MSIYVFTYVYVCMCVHIYIYIYLYIWICEAQRISQVRSLAGKWQVQLPTIAGYILLHMVRREDAMDMWPVVREPAAAAATEADTEAAEGAVAASVSGELWLALDGWEGQSKQAITHH